MRVDTIAVGRAAVNLLSLRIINPESARMTLTIHATLVERESVSRALRTPPRDVSATIGSQS